MLATVLAASACGPPEGARDAVSAAPGPPVAGDAAAPSATSGPATAHTATPDATVADARDATPPPVTAPEVPWADVGAVEPDALAAGFAGTVSPITPDLAERMSASWRDGCPVPLADLRYVTVTHRTFDGGAATGELVVHADVADSVVAVFGELFALGYPVRSMRLVDDFGGSDDASMAADNTSAFNCRPISRGTGWSEHAYGRAIDLNPVENPYVRGALVLPPEGEPFASRPDVPGVVHAGDAVVRAFAAHGWQWGGDWVSPADYQHFSTTGR
ncbi:M15 family metallopeptidase [Cellulomonas sp. C5510]|nr:M15 family metallopeptidase [Cellulomonas sp. C5510]